MLTKTRWPFPRILAHRGSGTLAPENTLVGIRLAASFGFAGVEVDAQAAACGTPFLLHDDTLDRTTDGRGTASARTMEQLRTLDAGAWFGNEFAGERIPTLEAACALCRSLGQWMNVEIKVAAGDDPERTGALVAGMVARLWSGASPAPLLSSFSGDALAGALEHAPAVPRALLVDSLEGDWMEPVRRLGCAAVHVPHGALGAAGVEAIRARGVAVAAWTVNDPGRALTLFEWGVDAVVTDELREIRPDFLSIHGIAP
ncbi:MAG: glycerophosphodiester phosphodiesterase [Betaproteobacteria bacterium]|jgi:glycerophosphoryl diester phosphodiesterase